MRMTRRFFSLGLAAAAVLALALPTSAGTSAFGPNCKSGPTEGGFKLPSAGAPGEMKGVLKSPGGNVVLRLEAKLSPPSSTQTGKMVGALIKMTAAGPKKVAEIHGVWKPTSMTDGGFHAVFTVATATGPDKVGKMTGTYKNGPAGNGIYKGKWILCK